MSSPIKSFVIPSVQCDISAGFIAEVFEQCEIAKLGTIKFTYPANKRFKFATVNVVEWIDSEAAYRFIRLLRCAKDGTRIFYDDESYWTAKMARTPKPLHWAKSIEKKYATRKFPTCDFTMFRVNVVERRESDLDKSVNCDGCIFEVTYRDMVFTELGDVLCKSCFEKEGEKAYAYGTMDKCTCHTDLDNKCKSCYYTPDIHTFTAYTSVN